MSAGRVVVLNGTSSAGKSSLGRALQDLLLPELWLVIGIDLFITSTPWRLFGSADGHTINPDGTIDVGPGFSTAQQRWRHGIAAMAGAGADLILDEVLLRGGEEQAEWQAALDGLDITWVKVHCDVEVAEARERARGDRAPNMARAQAAAVHEGVDYDLVVDTTAQPPEAVAAEVLQHLRGR